MSRLILLIVLVVLVYLVLRGLRRPGARRPAHRLPEKMVSCEVCGINLPESESMSEGARHFCCEEHRNQARKPPPT